MNNEHEDGPREYASPPCFQHQFEPPRRHSTEEIAAQLNQLLEGERAGARGLREMGHSGDAQLDDTLRAVGLDEARYCGMLVGHLERLGHPASRRTGVFYDKLVQREGLQNKLSLLDRGQTAVVRMLDELLPSIDDASLHADLVEMRDTHVRNVEKCARFLDSAPSPRT